MMMKRILTAVLALCLLLSLTACAELALPHSIAAPETKAPETKAPETKAPETKAPETKAPETRIPESPTELSRGVVNGRVYTNGTLGLRVDLPKDCVFYTEEQIAQANNMSAELFRDTNLADAIAQSGQLIDMIFGTASGDNTNLVIQANDPSFAFYTEEQIFQLLEEFYRSQFQSAGFEVKTYETVKLRFLGEERSALHVALSGSVGTIDEYQIWETGLSEDYMAIISVTIAAEGGDPQPMLDAFSKTN